MAQLTDRQVEQYGKLLIDQISQIEGDWSKPWVSVESDTPQNIDGRPYQGLNRLMLSMYSLHKGFEHPAYITFLRAKEENIKINAGEKSFPITYTSPYIKHRDTGERIKEQDYINLTEEEKLNYIVSRVFKVSNVFNIAQTDIQQSRPELYAEISDRFTKTPVLDNADRSYRSLQMDRLIEDQKWICPIHLDGENRAYYRTSTHSIHLPTMEQFISNERFYSTALHEMAHSTAPELKRDLSGEFGSDSYAREELVAELSASITGLEHGLPKTIVEENAKYLNNWLQVLKEEPEYLKNILEDVSQASNLMLKELNQIEIEHSQSIEFQNKVEALVTEHLGIDNDVEPHTQHQKGNLTKEEFLQEAKKDLFLMYSSPEYMTSKAIPKGSYEQLPELQAMVEKREALISSYKRTEETSLIKEKEQLEDKIRAYIQEQVKHEFPKLPTREDKEQLINSYIIQMTGKEVSSDPNMLVHTATYKDISLQVKELPAPLRLDQLVESHIVLNVENGHIQYDAKTRYREGFTLEDNPEHRALLNDNFIKPVQLSNGRLFISNTEFWTTGDIPIDKLQPAFGMGLLPKLDQTKIAQRLDSTRIFSEEEKNALIEGKPVVKEQEFSRGYTSLMYYIDKDLNQLRSIEPHKLQLPEQISKIPLSKEDIIALQAAKEIHTFDKENHIYYRASVRPQENNHLSLEYRTALNEDFKRVPTVESPEEEKIKYIAVKGLSGIDDIWGKEGVKQERDDFLDRYNVQEPYREYLQLKEAGEPGVNKQQNEEIKQKFQENNQPSQTLSR